MKSQALRLHHVGKTLQDTILVVNTHAILLNKTLLSVGKLVEVMNHDMSNWFDCCWRIFSVKLALLWAIWP